MSTYTYTDNRKGEVVFQVKAESIAEADKAYQAKFGAADMRSLVWIGCRITNEEICSTNSQETSG